MPGLFFESGIDKGFEQDLKKINSKYNSFSSNVTKGNDAMSKSFTNLAATVGAAFSVAQLVRFGKDSVNLYREQQKALAQVEQGLKSTGNAAGLTFEELQKGASDLQKTTLFGDEDILQNATAQLLTFTNIADDQFTRTQKVALDLATRLGGDLKSSAIQLGKALNDPVANLSALSRSGIQFSTEQKGLIKTLAETGRLAEAQTVILDELEKQYGGSAEAAAKADGGFTQLSNSLGDVQETIGGVITEGLQPFIVQIQEFLNSLTEEEIKSFIANVKDGAQVIAILVTALVAWKAGLLIMNQIQKINTALTALNTQARVASARAGKEVTRGNILMAGSFKKLKAAFIGNPIGALIAGLALVIPLIQEFSQETSTAIKVQGALDDINIKAQKSIAQQQSNLEQLLAIAKDETISLEKRQKAVENLNKISPEYLGNLSLQTINTDDAKKATDAYTLSLIKNARIQAAKEKLVELEKELIDLREKGTGAEVKWYKQIFNVVTSGGDVVKSTTKGATQAITNLTEKEQELIEIRKALLSITKEEVLVEKSRGKTKSTTSSKILAADLKNFKKLLSEQKKAYQTYNKDIEGLSGTRLKIVEKEYEDLISQGNNYLDFLSKLLAKEKDAKKQTIIKREIAVTTQQNTILEQQAAQEFFDKTKEDLKALADEYRNYSQKRADIEREYTSKITRLRKAGYSAQAQQAEKALQQELKRLDSSLLASNAKFQTWLQKDLPAIAKEGIAALQAELDLIELKLQDEGLDPEQVTIYQAKILELNKALETKSGIELTSEESWKDTLEIINGINELTNDLISTFDGMSESTKNVVKGLTSAISGALNLAQAIKAVSAASKGLETASAILAVIAAAIKVVIALSNAMKKAAELRKEAYLNEIRNIQAVNIELIKQNALYKEGNELFTSDKWGTALQGLKAYNTALEAQEELLLAISESDEARNIEGAFRKGEEQIENARENAKQLATELERALGSIVVRTKDRSNFGNFLGLSDEFASLLSIYPNIIDAAGQLDVAIAKNVVSTADLSDEERLRLENLVELTEQAEEVYAQFGDYISSIFGSVADDITQAFQVMYETGEDAMLSLEGTFSEMIESFTRDAIEFAFLQPYLNELNDTTKSLGEQFAKGEISADELQTNIINTLGLFYDSLSDLQPQILQAYENADVLAAAAGFESAFETPEVDPAIEEVIIPDIVIPEIEIPDIVIPEIEIPDPVTPEVLLPDVITPEEKEFTVSTPGAITQVITEQTGTILAGRIGALVLSNEKVLINSYDMLEYAIQNLVYMKQIKLNTDHLPKIEENTRRMYEKLDSV